MSKETTTLSAILSRLDEGPLLAMYQEIERGVVPASGAAHSFCKSINRLIDKGTVRINPSDYRRVYLPTLVKHLNNEMARRHARLLEGVTYVAADLPVQLQLDLTAINSMVLPTWRPE